MSRKRFNERQVIETLVRQGSTIVCYRSKKPITLENVGRMEREHILEVALGGADTPENCVYSLSEEHDIITNGNKATSAGSSKHRIAKVKRLQKNASLPPQVSGTLLKALKADYESLVAISDGKMRKSAWRGKFKKKIGSRPFPSRKKRDKP